MSTTFVLIHGAGGDAWQWHLVEPVLRGRGHDVVAMDLPADDESAGLLDYTDTVVDAIGDRTNLVLVAHSFGGYTAPLVCARLPVERLVLVAGMVPYPGEPAGEYLGKVSYEGEPVEDGLSETDGAIARFMHDVPKNLAREALSRGRDQAGNPLAEPWPLETWPDVPTTYLLCRNDRMFPAEWTRQVVKERLGITPDEIDSGHFPALSRPKELADRLEAYAMG